MRAPGSGMRDTEKLHRIDPAVIKQEVTPPGFELVEESKLLANPTDDHTQMVFCAGPARHDRSVGVQVPQAGEVTRNRFAYDTGSTRWLRGQSAARQRT